MKLFSWGANNYGQLGLGCISEQCNLPTEVHLNRLCKDNITAIEGGGGHVFILDNNGNVFGCGSNRHSQLGLTDCSLTDIKEFLKIQSLDEHKISKISCGWDSSFAVTEEGQILAWGSNAHGQLGIQTEKKTLSSPLLLPISGVVSVSSGLRHTAILLKNGKVMTCGKGNKGQLGLIKDEAPVTGTDTFQEVPGINNVKMLSCGQHHTIALTEDGNLIAWGDNKHGQLGCDPSVSSSVQPIVIKNDGIKNNHIINMKAGWTHSVFLTDDGKIINNGRNSYGQLGISKESTLDTWKLREFEFNKKIKQVAVGSEHNFIITDGGEIYSWGWNEHGNCGLGTTNDVFTPTRIQIKNKAVLIGTGSAHSFALVE